MLRRQLVGADDLFGEPAWDMLIDLFIHEAEARPVSTSSLGIASGLGMSSALRLVQRLCDAGLVTREADRQDGRRNFIRLTPDLAHRLTAYFAAGDE
ncbi:DNA repair protein RadC [Sphingopyxis sp. LC81]|nr:DNA repair protein RadC [Sphingopyxis sp. LC81]